MHYIDCVAQAVYYEARGESVLGQRAIAYVVLNRGKDPCKVIHKNCEFSWTCQRLPNPYGTAWIAARNTASYAISHRKSDITRGATHFHSGRKPYWVRSMKFTVKIGGHYFYKEV